MRERPIIFSAPMIRALLDGRKTQTRRVVRDSLVLDPNVNTVPTYVTRRDVRERGKVIGHREVTVECPHGAPGDRLWVRETWAQVIRRPVSAEEAWWPGKQPWRGVGTRPSIPSQSNSTSVVIWRADGEMPANFPEPWRPSIFMPRWASRITLELTAVRVERLQDISEADARAEGLEDSAPFTYGWRNYGKTDLPGESLEYFASARESYASLWDSLNAKRAPWASNPWVWVLEFRRVGT